MIGWRLWALLAAAVALGAAVWRLNSLEKQLAVTRAENAEFVSSLNVAGASFAAAMRATEQTWADRMEKEQYDGQTRINTAQHDAAAARAAADSLRATTDRYRAAATAAAHPCTTTSGPATTDAIHLYADLFAGADDAAGELAKAADLAHAAGLTCERAYDALRAATVVP